LREIYVVQVNVDPEGEMIAPDAALWRMADDGDAKKGWWAGPSRGSATYGPNELSGLQSPAITLPAAKDGLELMFEAKWDMESEFFDGTKIGETCYVRGWDGVQVRVLTYDAEGKEEKATVIAPLDPEGYGKGPHEASAIASFVSAYRSDASATCPDLSGWTGVSRGWTSQRFSLQEFANRTVRVEWFFASDSSGAGEGFWVNAVKVSAGGAAVFEGRESDFSQHRYGSSPKPGERGRHDGVPVVAALPAGYTADQNLQKVYDTRSAPWSATWTTGKAPEQAAKSAVDLRRAYLGWSYKAPVDARKTVWLHPGQEGCVLQRAPFRGELRVAFLFALLDKIGVSATSLVLRKTRPPFAVLNGSGLMLSSSPGVRDPGTHRFAFGGKGPVFEEGEDFLMCVGIGEERHLPADDPARAPFLHLPLREISTAGERGEVGATALILKPRPGDEGVLTTELNPWKSHTFVLRSEFVEVAASGAAAPARTFLAPAPAASP